MRAFAGGFYSNLRAMYDYLGVTYHAQPFLYSFTKGAARDAGPDQKAKRASYFVHSSNNHRIIPVRPEGIRTATWLMEILYLLLWYTWFSVCCFFVAPRAAVESIVCETLGEYLRRIRVPEYFVNYYLLPLMSSVATCSHKDVLGFPAVDVTDYKRRTHGAQHYTVTNGVQNVQSKLAKGIVTKLSATVLSVETGPSGVRVCWRASEDTNSLAVREEIFDRVILAVPPDVVGKIFRPLQYNMAQIPTVPVESIIHNGDARRPGQPTGHSTAATTSPLYRNAAQTIHLRTSTEGTHCTESIHEQPSGALVTTCPFSYIDPDHIFKTARFTRVLRTPESRHVVNSIFDDCRPVEGDDGEKQRIKWTNGDGAVWLVGGWCWDGMVLLEGCIVSAMRVAEAFDVSVPWSDPRGETQY